MEQLLREHVMQVFPFHLSLLGFAEQPFVGSIQRLVVGFFKFILYNIYSNQRPNRLGSSSRKMLK